MYHGGARHGDPGDSAHTSTQTVLPTRGERIAVSRGQQQRITGGRGQSVTCGSRASSLSCGLPSVTGDS
jgi:hypothetical protein